MLKQVTLPEKRLLGGELNISGQGKMSLNIMHKVDSEEWSKGARISRTIKRSGLFHKN